MGWRITMLPGFVLSLREGIEAALIIGIILGALRKMQRQDLRSAVWTGAGIAALLSFGIAWSLTALGASLEGPAEPVFEGITMALAAGVLTWMIFWMQNQSRRIKGELETGVRQALFHNGQKALVFLALVAVLREGVELALFLTAAALAEGAQQTLIGALLGLAVSAFLGWALFSSMLRLDLKRFFQVTGVLLILFAAGLVAHSVKEFNEIYWIPAVITHLYNVNFLLNEQSFLGQVLSSLFGYHSNPSLTEVIAYVAYFVAIFIGMRANRSAPIPITPKSPPNSSIEAG